MPSAVARAAGLSDHDKRRSRLAPHRRAPVVFDGGSDDPGSARLPGFAACSMHRLGTAWAVIFLASDRANFITGETLYLSGDPRTSNSED